MRLVATQPGRNVREGTAQLATGNADPLTYVASALLANGASLIEVHADHVVLRRGDSITELYVDGMARTARAAKAAPVDEALITVEKPVARKDSRAVGPETYASIVRTAPRFVDNTVAGFEVYPGTDAGALSRLNLQSGDVLLEIDGRVLESVEQLHGSLKSIRGGASLMATVQRGSEQLVVMMDGAMLKVREPSVLAELPPR
jgi:type II secretory pathway component PulC